LRDRTFAKSVRFNIIAAISVMGLLGLTFSLLTGEWYKRLVFENERQLQTQILAFKAMEDLQQHNRLTRTLSESLQQSPSLRTALQQRDRESLTRQLNGQFHQYLVTSGQLELLQLATYDTNFKLVARSTEPTALGDDQSACGHILRYAQQRHGADRLKALSDLCPHPQHALHAELMPIGGLRPLGYLMVISNPLTSLRGISEELHGPLDIRLSNGRLLVEGKNEGQAARQPGWAIAEHVISNRGGTPVLTLQLHKDISELGRKLNNTRLTIMLAASIITLLAMALAFAIMRQNLLMPLAQLTRKVQSVRDNRTHLGERVPLQGSSEIQALAASFNDMSTELADLYVKLEQQAFSDPLTQLPNRSWFHDHLQRLRSLADREDSGFALLMLDLSKFKPVNDKLGHQTGDLVLRTIADRIHAVLRGSDYLARADLVDHSSESLARMGGDEFAILLPSTQRCEAAVQVAEKIASAVSRPIETATTSVQLGINIGIALYPQDADTTDRLIYCADLAMYDAKSRGDAYTCYTPSLDRKPGT
jgi:diguanylate cyclase (GGDEF)-like protein